MDLKQYKEYFIIYFKFAFLLRKYSYLLDIFENT